MGLVFQSAVASLVIQILVGSVTTAAFFVDTSDEKRTDIQVILALELSSQVIEFFWYLTVVLTYAEIKTWTRYIDWVISTPVMLVSTALFFQHRNGSDLGSIFQTWWIYATLAFNWIMLAFGFAAERGLFHPPTLAIFLGGFAFVASFTCLSIPIRENDDFSVGLFWVMYGVWGLYGIAAVLPYRPKNVAYNCLDLVSKNFYGVFLFIYTIL